MPKRSAVETLPAQVKRWLDQALVDGNFSGYEALADELKTRGFDKAGLYDPPGVGGTHVMYVLHHADRPSLYAGLPDNPHISVLVSAWKGIVKPLALAGIAFTAAASFFHWIVAGPNEVQPEDDEAAQHLRETAAMPAPRNPV